ncbi:unnamed protein product, partial [Urochloa humidicola]
GGRASRRGGGGHGVRRAGAGPGSALDRRREARRSRSRSGRARQGPPRQPTLGFGGVLAAPSESRRGEARALDPARRGAARRARISAPDAHLPCVRRSGPKQIEVSRISAVGGAANLSRQVARTDLGCVDDYAGRRQAMGPGGGGVVIAADKEAQPSPPPDRL